MGKNLGILGIFILMNFAVQASDEVQVACRKKLRKNDERRAQLKKSKKEYQLPQNNNLLQGRFPRNGWRRTDLRVDLVDAILRRDQKLESDAWMNRQQHTAKRRFFNRVDDLTKKMWFEDVIVDLSQDKKDLVDLFSTCSSLGFQGLQLRIVSSSLHDLAGLIKIREKENLTSYQERRELLYKYHYAKNRELIVKERQEVENRLEQEALRNEHKNRIERLSNYCTLS